MLTVNTTAIFEGRVPNEELVSQHTKCPIINLLIVLSPFHHLRWQIVQRSTQRHTPIPGSVYAPTKVADLQLAVDPQEQVLRLDITMNNVFPMQVHQRVRHLIDIPRTAFLRETPVLAKLFVELALAGKLEHEEDPLGVVEVSIQT